MSKSFRSGDLVRCTKDCAGAFTRNNIYTVKGMHKDFVGPIRVSLGRDDVGSTTNGWCAEYFELVIEDPKTDEELLKLATEGLKARNTLRKRGHVLQVLFKDGTYADSTGTGVEYRIKPKPPVFEPMEIGSWAVTLEGSVLQIGCRRVNAEWAIRALTALMDNSMGYKEFGFIEVRATRKGIKFEGDLLTWADAEKLLKALQKAFK